VITSGPRAAIPITMLNDAYTNAMIFSFRVQRVFCSCASAAAMTSVALVLSSSTSTLSDSFTTAV